MEQQCAKSGGPLLQDQGMTHDRSRANPNNLNDWLSSRKRKTMLYLLRTCTPKFPLWQKDKKLLIKFLLIPPIRERQGSSPLLPALGYFHDDKMLWQHFVTLRQTPRELEKRSLSCLIAQLWNSTFRLLLTWNNKTTNSLQKLHYYSHKHSRWSWKLPGRDEN